MSQEKPGVASVSFTRLVLRCLVRALIVCVRSEGTHVEGVMQTPSSILVRRPVQADYAAWIDNSKDHTNYLYKCGFAKQDGQGYGPACEDEVVG